MADTRQEYDAGAEYKNVQQPSENYAADYSDVTEPTYPGPTSQASQSGYDARNDSYGDYTNDEANNYPGSSYTEPGGTEGASSGEANKYSAKEGYSGEYQYSAETGTYTGSDAPGGDDY